MAITPQSADSHLTALLVGGRGKYNATLALRSQTMTFSYGPTIASGSANTLTLTASSAINLTGPVVASSSLTVGGGYGSTGVTISAAGVIQANGAITTDGALTAASAEIGGGFGSTGVSISAAGVIQADGAITSGGLITGTTMQSTGVLQLGATTTAALAFGGGTSASPLTTAVADKNFIGVWSQSTATSGDSRAAYIRHYLGGTIATTGYGDAVRSFMTVTGTGYSAATGIHSSCQVNDAASVTGLGAAVRATLAVNSTVAQGTLAALVLEGSNSATVSATEMAYIRFQDGSAGTKIPFLFSMDANADDIIVTSTEAGSDIQIPFKTPAGTYYLKACTAVS